MIRISIVALAVLQVLTWVGCAAEVGGPSAYDGDLEPVVTDSAATLASLDLGDRSLRFVDLDGEVGFAETFPAGELPLSASLPSQQATALDLYVTLTGHDEQQAPAALVEAHYASVERAPRAIELIKTPPEGLELPAGMELPQAPTPAEEAARGVSEWSGTCRASTLTSIHALIGALAGHGNYRTLASSSYTLWGNASASASNRAFHYSSCSRSNYHVTGVQFANFVWVDVGEVGPGEVFHFAASYAGASWYGFSDGGSNGRLAYAGSQTW